ncbi:MAG: proprotein convertase P-domain-containing protein [Myxococcota bacterium]|nr:proprotein convertase P-domain-containing protein [Myxococcota bacterium]
MNRVSTWWVLAWALISALGAEPAEAQNALSLAIRSVAPNGELQVELNMDFSDTTVGGAVALNYDSSAIVIDSIEFNPELNDDPDFRCPGSSEIPCPSGVDFLSFGSVTGLSGEVTVAILTAQSLGEGPAQLDLAPGSPFSGVGGANLTVSLTGVELEPGVPVPLLGPGMLGGLVSILVFLTVGYFRGSRKAAKAAGTCMTLLILLSTPAARAQSTGDTDGDGVLDSVDNCTQASNPAQVDSDGDGFGNRCDPDLDGDGHVDANDLIEMKSVFLTANADADLDSNGIVNFLDLGRMAAYFNGVPGPTCPGCPPSAVSGEFAADVGSPLAIPDDASAQTSHSLVIETVGTILDLEVSVRLTHGWVGDLVVTLTHEDTGTSVVLIDRAGVPDSGFGCSGSDIDALLDDQAADPVEEACASPAPAIAGSLRPEEALSAFDGEGIGGTWTLTAVDAGFGVSGTLDAWGLFLNSPLAPPSVDMVAYRPQSEAYDAPLQRRAVLEADENGIGAGVRINGDDDDGDGVPDRENGEVSSENDLIEVELRFDETPASAGTEYVLRRSSDHVRVWSTQTKGQPILDVEDEAVLEPASSVESVWVESPEGGEADLTFELRDSQTLEILASDEVHFFSFTSLTIGLHGEFQFPTDPVYGPNEGISYLAVDLHEEGYDSHMYDEDDVAADGSGPVYDEIVDAVQSRGVTSVALYGFSHGAGSIYDLSERLQLNQASIGDFDILFTAYIDGIENDSDVDLDSEIRLPLGTQYHVNYYQQWGFIPPWGDSVAGADVDVNVTSTGWGSFLWHITITNSSEVQSGIFDPILLRVPR